jgi:Phage integrase, N-terminal SAM-like domain
MAEIGGGGSPWASSAVCAIASPVSRPLAAGTVRPNLAPSTVANYEFFSNAYINPSLGSKRLDRLTVRDVQLWMNDLRERCQCCAQGRDAARRRPRCCTAGACCRQIASEWTRHQAWTILQSALSAAVRDELVSRNVAALVKVSTPRARRALVWTVDQSGQFLCERA